MLLTKGRCIIIRFNYHKTSIIIVLFVAIFAMGGLAQAATITVGPLRRGYDFRSIQAGIDAANDGDEVLVTPGEYVITTSITFRGRAITVRSETGPEQTTIRMTGDNNVVLFENGEDSQSLLEGFTITGSGHRGVSCVNSSPRIENCMFIANQESGVQCLSASPIINNCIITGSVGDSGINCRDNSSPIITDCTIWGNIAQGSGGGGIYCNDSSPTITKCTISENEAEYAGGGIECINSSPTLIDCSIIYNFANNGSGMHNNDNSHPTLTNCTISGNSAQSYGGGIFNNENSSSTVINCIIWGNTARDGAQIYNDQYSLATVSYSDVQYTGKSRWPGEGNIDTDPLFVDPDNGDYHLKSIAGRWDPNSQSWLIDEVNSPCIDAGNPDSPIAFEPYPNGITINMGAYGGTTEASKSPSGLNAKYGYGTGEPDNPYLIYNAEQLNTLGAEPNDWDKHFKLMADVNMVEFSYDRAVIAPDTNDIENGFQGTSFTSVFDGNGHRISHLTIQGGSFLGLFGQLAYGAKITHLGLEAVDVNGTGDYIGGLMGAGYGCIIDCYSTGIINGTGNNIGGLLGLFSQGIVLECYSNCTVSGWEYIGGLIGFNDVDGVITMNYSSGYVTGNEYVGGLVASNYGSIEMNYSENLVTANSSVGGLVGENYGSIYNCYSIGLVIGNNNVGGLVGLNNGDCTSSFWDIETSGRTVSECGTGLKTVQMQTENIFTNAGWDFVGETENGDEDIWWIIEWIDYPRLWWELIPEN